MKTPITYYGGKQLMIKDILPMIPAHYSYIEPFVGGGAIFFAKQPAKINVIYDDALVIIKRYDKDGTFFYCAPPYINTDCGQYANYTENDYKNLLELLSNIKGRFLLSGFPNDILKEYVSKNNWFYKEIEKAKPSASFQKEGIIDRTKTETLTWNYKGMF